MSIDVTTASREELVNFSLSLQIENKNQQAKITLLEQKISWFKRQLFGRKSEKQLSQDPLQVTLFEVPQEPPSEKATIKSYERSCRTNPTDTSEGEGQLRFDESVPVDEVIVLPHQVEGLSEEEYEVIGEKVTTRLKQIPCSYRVEKTIRKTVKIKANQKLHTDPARY